ncbi:MAG: hypothetical protein H5T85_03925 [Actinobacteria bacterium]|nr:hypothetical protein [Actinomycetota bacterium]
MTQIDGLAGIAMEKLHFKSRPSSHERGAVLIVVTLLLPVFVLLMGMVVDIGRALAYKAELNKACMIAAEEASKSIDIRVAQVLGINRLSEDYSTVIKEYFTRNYQNKDYAIINYVRYRVIGGTDNPKYIEVYCEAKLGSFFLKTIGIDYIVVHASANGRLRRLR